MTWEKLAEASRLTGIDKKTLDQKGRRGRWTVKYAADGSRRYWVGADSAPESPALPPEVAEAKAAALAAAGVAPADEPGEDSDVEDLIDRRVAAFQRKAARKAKKVHRVEANAPFAVCHFGDPHVDDDGCDWPELLRTIDTIKATPGMRAGNVGDTINNWVGRLEKLYKHQTTTEGEAFALAGWLMRAVPWDYVVLGNHDHWNQGSIIFDLLARDSQIVALEPHEARIEYVSPRTGNTCRTVIRHDFKGHSMWNKSHAAMKVSKMRPWGDLYVCGHRHIWSINREETHDKRIATALRVRGFKRFDDYADAGGFQEDSYGASITTIHDLDHPLLTERMRVFHDVEEAAAYLGWLRARAAKR